ncbi:cysteine desulfurase family protein [uncultured Cohaesibacter sp.]|uniref:cysteine desulfurase family protein n=1 Tax=uncultured Cohaesibacter sp. TaxID=1002546 RepID=UPI0029C7EFC1|nr:cysteine desulfurase family protein [uncultured Cohaesibacter sp.]
MKIGQTIYFDHQATTPLDFNVYEAMQPYTAESFGNPHSSEHIIGWRARKAVDKAASDVAELIGADADEMIFTSGATEANNLALLGLARGVEKCKRKRILLSEIEHKCVLEIGRVLQKELNYEVRRIPVDDTGSLKLKILEEEMDEDVLLVSIMAVNNEIGTIQDIPAISRITSRYGSVLHCDAAQAPCALDITSLAQYADLVSLSGHKMYGPMGVGALYARRSLHNSIQPIIYGGGQQNGLRPGTLPTPLCVGLGAAAKQMIGELASAERKAVSIRRDLFARLVAELPFETWVNGPAEGTLRHPGNINIGFSGVSAADLLNRLQPRLAASSGSACSSGITEPSHVLRAIGLGEKDASSSVRFSIGRHTSDDDIYEAVEVLQASLEDIRENGLL